MIPINPYLGRSKEDAAKTLLLMGWTLSEVHSILGEFVISYDIVNNTYDKQLIRKMYLDSLLLEDEDDA